MPRRRTNRGTRRQTVIQSITNRDLSLYALEKVGGLRRFVPTEDVAVKAFEIYPSRFSLIRYPQFPDVDTVRVSLTDLRKPKYGSLAEGDKRKGWRITGAGADWLWRHRKSIERAASSRLGPERRVASGRMVTRQKVVDELTRLVRDSEAYTKWRSKEPLTVYDFFDVMRVDAYTPEETYRNHLRDMLSAFRNDSWLTIFIRHLDRTFGTSYRQQG